jgi:MFS family permease
LAGALGPVLGGWLVDSVGWRSIFLINVPVAAGAGFMAWKYVDEDRESLHDVPLDLPGAGLATAALGLLAWALPYCPCPFSLG